MIIAFIFILVLFLALYILQRNRNKIIPEGFTTEYNTDTNGVKNPLENIVKKLTKISTYFLNPDIWTQAIKTYNMTATELARMELDKKPN